MDAYQTLVVILSITLAIALVLLIIALVKVIQLVNNLKAIAQKAEEVADKVENISSFFQKTSATMAVGKLISNIFETVRHKGSKKKGGNDE